MCVYMHTDTHTLHAAVGVITPLFQIKTYWGPKKLNNLPNVVEKIADIWFEIKGRGDGSVDKGTGYQAQVWSLGPIWWEEKLIPGAVL